MSERYKAPGGLSDLCLAHWEPDCHSGGVANTRSPPEPPSFPVNFRALDDEPAFAVERDSAEIGAVLPGQYPLGAQKREAERRTVVRTVIGRNRAAIFSHPMSSVSGNPKGDVTLVEFFDYQCGYCKRSLKPMKDLLASNRELRVVWKEFPILGPVSRFAARAAMATDKQGRYRDFHVAVMGAPGKLTEASVIAAAGRLGLDVERLRRDMQDPAIENYLDETIGLARKLGIGGTPAFVIGDAVVPGAVGVARLRKLIADVRGG